MQFDWWTFALQTINFAILVWLLHRFLYKPVLAAVDARRAEIDKTRDDIDRAKADADKRLADLEAERAGIAAEREAAMKSATAEAERAAEARHERAEREAAAIVEEARKTLVGERREALAALQEASLEFGVKIAQRLLDEIPLDYRAEAWLERLSDHLAGLGDDKRNEITSGLTEGQPLQVVTAVPLSSAITEKWRKRLRGDFGAGTVVVFDVDPALIAGVELHFPDTILRFSWRSQLAAMRAEIESHEYAR